MKKVLKSRELFIILLRENDLVFFKFVYLFLIVLQTLKMYPIPGRYFMLGIGKGTGQPDYGLLGILFKLLILGLPESNRTSHASLICNMGYRNQHHG